MSKTVIAEAFGRIVRWMRANDAEFLADNLAAGANAEALAAVTRRLGHAPNAELAALWTVHDGQLEELNPFFEDYDLLSSSLADTEDVTRFLGFIRKHPSADTLARAGLTAAELASDAWIRFCARDSDGMAVNLETGRVFRIFHDDSPPLRLHSGSVTEWLVGYADAIEAGDYYLDEGFGDGCLTRRNRKAERAKAEREAAKARERERKDALTPAALLADAIARNHDADARAALERAAGDATVLAALFAAPPSFVAATLRPLLRSVTLTPAQWAIVAEGGAAIGNNAVRDYANAARARS